LDDIYRRFVRLADKDQARGRSSSAGIDRDTHKPSSSATPLFEPLSVAAAASVSAHEAQRPFSAGSAD